VLDAAPAARTDASLAEVMGTMRAMRRLRPDPVPEALIDELIEAAMLAPTGSHQQGELFVVVTDRARMARLAELWREAARIYEGWLAKADPRFGTDPTWNRTWDAIRYQRDHFAETPVVIVACYDQRDYIRRAKSMRREIVVILRRIGPRRGFRFMRNLSSADIRSEAGSIYPAVENLLLAARARGLAANMTTWHFFVEAEFKAALGIPKDVRTYAVIPIGWPMGNFGPVRRRPVDEVIRREHW
jgi:nitroreductase